MTLTEFLLARIAEDERDVPHLFDIIERVGGQLIDLRARYLADCEAKRRIVERERANGIGRPDAFPWNIATLALPYADHPDYREEWKP